MENLLEKIKNFKNYKFLQKLIFIFVILIILIVVFLLIYLNKFGKKEVKVIENEEISEYSTYVGNNFAMYNLLKKLPYSDSDISVKSDNATYGHVVIKYNINGNEERMKYITLVLFSLVQNLDSITYDMVDNDFTVKKDDYSRLASFSLDGIDSYINEDNIFGDNQNYRLAINKNGMKVFKNPTSAYEQFKIDYSDAINLIKSQFKLFTLSKLNYKKYEKYGAQVNTDDKTMQQKCSKVSQFFDIYENSYNDSVYNPT